MKDTLLKIVDDYLKIFKDERKRQEGFIDYLNKSSDSMITDWNNFDGHIVAGGFVYSKKEQRFLVLYHKDLKMFLYPGGHVDYSDKNPLEAALREIKEETGLNDLKEIRVCSNELVPIDIDTQVVEYNKRINLPSHYHYDFRYLFVVDRIGDIKIDIDELSCYKWISIDELSSNPNYVYIIRKIDTLLKIANMNDY